MDIARRYVKAANDGRPANTPIIKVLAGAGEHAFSLKIPTVYRLIKRLTIFFFYFFCQVFVSIFQHNVYIFFFFILSLYAVVIAESSFCVAVFQSSSEKSAISSLYTLYEH